MKHLDGKHLWILLATALATTGLYAFVVVHDTGRLWVPLDDAFIYAQYAKEMAQGHPYEYHAGEGLSTGVTSPLYPWLLVPAFWVGLGGEAIAWWWLGLGLLWRLWTAWLVYGLTRRWTRDRRPAFFAALLTLLQGYFNWGVSSGMEVGMMAVALLEALRAGQRWLDRIDEIGSRKERRRRWAFGIALAFLAFSRPEGTATALAALPLIAFWLRRRGGPTLRAGAALGLSLLPWVAWMLVVRAKTGTFTTAGSSVKTMLGIPGFDAPAILTTWFAGLRQTFSGDFMGTTSMPLWTWLAAATGCGALLWRTGKGWRAPSDRLPPVFLVGLMVPALSFVPLVHMARYQAGHIPLLIALGVYGIWRIGVLVPRARGAIWGGTGAIAVLFTICGLLFSAQRFAMQTEDMFFLHRRVADWIRKNTKETDRIALTDAGIFPYLSGRPSLDFVGLTNREMMGMLGKGSGAVWHKLERMKPEYRPQYAAMFPAWFDATELGPVVANFRVDRVSIAVGPEMVITRWMPPLYWVEKRVPPEARSLASFPPTTEEDLKPKKDAAESAWKERGEDVARPSSTAAAAESCDEPTTPPWRLVDWLDLGDLESEQEHHYRRVDEAKWTALRPSSLVVAQASRDYVWKVADGGQTWTSRESFRVRNVRPDRPLRLSMRTYSDNPHRLRVVVEGREIGLLAIPKNGRSGIFDIVNLDVPPEALRDAATPRLQFELIRDGDKDEYPIHTSFFLWALQPADSVDAPSASDIETKLEDRIAKEETRWARAFREEHGDVIPMDSADGVLFQTGWDPPGTERDGEPFRWGTGPNSFVVIPAPARIAEKGAKNANPTDPPDPPDPSDPPDPPDTPTTPSLILEVDLEPYVPPSRPKQFWNWIAAEVNGHELIRWDIEPRRRSYRVDVPADILYPGVNAIRFVYARTYVPAEFEPGSPDVRPLGAKFYRIALRETKPAESRPQPTPDHAPSP